MIRARNAVEEVAALRDRVVASEAPTTPAMLHALAAVSYAENVISLLHDVGIHCSRTRPAYIEAAAYVLATKPYLDALLAQSDEGASAEAAAVHMLIALGVNAPPSPYGPGLPSPLHGRGRDYVLPYLAESARSRSPRRPEAPLH